MPRHRHLRTLSVGLCLALAVASCRTPDAAPTPPPAPAPGPLPEPELAPPPAEKKPPPPRRKQKRRPKQKRPATSPVPKPSPAPLDLSFLTSKTACTLVLGGATVTEEEGVEVDLAQANGAVTGAVYDRLARQGFRVEPLIVFTRGSGDRSRTVATELTKRRCSKIVQVSHFLQDPTFGFLVTVLEPVTDQFDPSRDVWRFHWKPLPYTSRYAFRYTEDAVFELDLEEVADAIARDLAASGMIARKEP